MLTSRAKPPKNSEAPLSADEPLNNLQAQHNKGALSRDSLQTSFAIEQHSKNWKPCSKIGRLVAKGKIKTLHQLFTVKSTAPEPEVFDFLDGGLLKIEVLKTIPLRKPKKYKVIVAVGCSGFLGISSCYKKELQDAITGATRSAKRSIRKIKIHENMRGKCGPIRVELNRNAGNTELKTPMSSLLLNMCHLKNFDFTCNVKEDLANQAFAIFDALTRD